MTEVRTGLPIWAITYTAHQSCRETVDLFPSISTMIAAAYEKVPVWIDCDPGECFLGLDTSYLTIRVGHDVRNHSWTELVTDTVDRMLVP
jgi:hypothetical protein